MELQLNEKEEQKLEEFKKKYGNVQLLFTFTSIGRAVYVLSNARIAGGHKEDITDYESW